MINGDCNVEQFCIILIDIEFNNVMNWKMLSVTYHLALPVIVVLVVEYRATFYLRNLISFH